jgi:hypothetical protein
MVVSKGVAAEKSPWKAWRASCHEYTIYPVLLLKFVTNRILKSQCVRGGADVTLHTLCGTSHRKCEVPRCARAHPLPLSKSVQCTTSTILIVIFRF